MHGTGVALGATKMILCFAFNDLHLKRVYLNVLKDNFRANAFYQKAGFVFDFCERYALEIDGVLKDLNWYSFTIMKFNRMNVTLINDWRK